MSEGWVPGKDEAIARITQAWIAEKNIVSNCMESPGTCICDPRRVKQLSGCAGYAFRRVEKSEGVAAIA